MLRGSSYSYKYINGNYLVTFSGGDLKKIAFRKGEDLIANFPDSIDLKISNRCSRGCPFCHENSVTNGGVLDVERTIECLSQLPKLPLEFAIGGGNILESLPESNAIVDWLISRGHRVRCTIKYEDLFSLTDPQRELLKKFEGIGISIDKISNPILDEYISKKSNDFYCYEFESGVNRHFNELLFNIVESEKEGSLFSQLSRIERDHKLPKFVIHIIAGVFPVDKLKMLLENSNTPILILGYKQWGRAKNTSLPESMGEFERIIKQYLYENRYLVEASKYERRFTVFDNLALEQLHIKDSLTSDEWDTLYMGDEGTHSMYIDAVSGQYARNSRSPERVSWDEVGLIDYFKSLRNDSGNN